MTLERNENVATLLQDAIEEFDCTSGTLHQMEGDVLNLVAHEGIPEPVLDRTEMIPIGKGMAGLAAERKEPVQVCNLQTDDSGVAQPDARKTGMEGSIAAPIVDSNDTLRGTIGIAKPDPYEFTPTERDQLLQLGSQIAHQL